MENVARSLGLLDVLVRIELGRGVKVDVPADAKSYKLHRIKDYESEMVRWLGENFLRSERPVVLLDCGADIGLVSALLVAASPSIRRVIAFEPNLRSFEVLLKNTELLGVEAEAHNVAVADFDGRGSLRLPAHDHHDHAAFLVREEHGDVPVMRVDQLGLPSGQRLLLKIDVEGGELAAVQGAAATLTSCERFCVVFEAHRLQSERTGIDPLEIVAYLNSLRPCRAVVAEDPSRPIDPTLPFFEQFPNKVSNLCVISEVT